MNLLHFGEASEGTKRVRPTGKAFNDILTDIGNEEVQRNKIEEQDFRSVHGEMVQV